jgi:hypothetical protein
LKTEIAWRTSRKQLDFPEFGPTKPIAFGPFSEYRLRMARLKVGPSVTLHATLDDSCNSQLCGFLTGQKENGI